MVKKNIWIQEDTGKKFTIADEKCRRGEYIECERSVKQVTEE